MDNRISFLEIGVMLNVNVFAVFRAARENKVPYQINRRDKGSMLLTDFAKNYKVIKSYIEGLGKLWFSKDRDNANISEYLNRNKPSEIDYDKKKDAVTSEMFASYSGDLFRVDTYADRTKGVYVWDRREIKWLRVLNESRSAGKEDLAEKYNFILTFDH